LTPAALRRTGARADGWLPIALAPGFVMPDVLTMQRRTIDDAARAAGRDPADIDTVVRINAAEGATPDEVAEAVRVLADGGYPDVFVDLMYVAGDTDDYLRWAERLLAG